MKRIVHSPLRFVVRPRPPTRPRRTTKRSDFRSGFPELATSLRRLVRSMTPPFRWRFRRASEISVSLLRLYRGSRRSSKFANRTRIPKRTCGVCNRKSPAPGPASAPPRRTEDAETDRDGLEAVAVAVIDVGIQAFELQRDFNPLVQKSVEIHKARRRMCRPLSAASMLWIGPRKADAWFTRMTKGAKTWRRDRPGVERLEVAPSDAENV